MFFRGSRYANVGEHEITDGKGRVIRYKRIRFIPEMGARFSYIVTDGERLDHISQSFYQNPELFWRVCDANLALWPDDLIAEAGRTILIPPPEG
jgi:hypothetical protein